MHDYSQNIVILTFNLVLKQQNLSDFVYCCIYNKTNKHLENIATKTWLLNLNNNHHFYVVQSKSEYITSFLVLTTWSHSSNHISVAAIDHVIEISMEIVLLMLYKL